MPWTTFAKNISYFKDSKTFVVEGLSDIVPLMSLSAKERTLILSEDPDQPVDLHSFQCFSLDGVGSHNTV